MKTFRDIQNLVSSGGEAIVFYGLAEAGTNEEHVIFDGLNEMWHKAKILPEEVNVTFAFTVQNKHGRKDFVVPLIAQMNVSRLALWRIQVWGGSDAGWASDYIVNYAHEHYPFPYRVKE